MRRTLSAILFAALVIGGIRPHMVSALRPSWLTSRPTSTPSGLSELPLRFGRDPMPPHLITFLETVEQVTPAGVLIAVMPPPAWDDPDPSYSRFRIGYVLAGHPLIIATPWSAAEVASAPYVAVWHSMNRPPAGRVVCTKDEGTLIRR